MDSIDEIVDKVVELGESLQSELDKLQNEVSNDPRLSDVGMDDVFLMRELPGIIRAVRDLPDEVRRDPMRSSELDQLETLLRRLDGLVR